MTIPRCNAIIFDIGDVLFTWSSKTTTSISPKLLHDILRSSIWFDYECGKLSEEECYRLVGAAFNLAPSDIREALRQARASLAPDDDMIASIEELKAHSGGDLRIFAMSNISAPDYEFLRTRPAKWDIFDQIFTSAGAGTRKPHLGFYKYVIDQTGVEPSRTVFVDDKPENVLSARSLGIHGLVFGKDSREEVKRALHNLTGDPIARGRKYMRDNARSHHSLMDNGMQVEENFAQLLILEATEDRSLVYLSDMPRAWNFFCDKAPHTQDGEFPFDMDTTSLGLTIYQKDKKVINSVMDEMLKYIDGDGILMTYFDYSRPRIDCVVCVNILTLFYANGRGAELFRTLQWVHNVLLNRAYLEGTRYYATAESFLYFMTRLLAASPESPELRDVLRPLLRERVQERIGAPADALALAMRILACRELGIPTDADLHDLLARQCKDGGWEMGWIYKFGGSGMLIGNRGLTTALALKAVEGCSQPIEKPPTPPLTPTSLPDTHSLEPPARSRSPLLSIGKNLVARLPWRTLSFRKSTEAL